MKKLVITEYYEDYKAAISEMVAYITLFRLSGQKPAEFSVLQTCGKTAIGCWFEPAPEPEQAKGEENATK